MPPPPSGPRPIRIAMPRPKNPVAISSTSATSTQSSSSSAYIFRSVGTTNSASASHAKLPAGEPHAASVQSTASTATNLSRSALAPAAVDGPRLQPIVARAIRIALPVVKK